MKTLAWGDKLCGKVIEPGGWLGWGMGQMPVPGIIAYVGSWHVVTGKLHKVWTPDHDDGMGLCWDGLDGYEHHADLTPIYPPRGWAGKSERELWLAMVGTSSKGLDAGLPSNIELLMLGRGDVYLTAYIYDAGANTEVEITNHLPTLIQALQNAEILSSRLKGES